MKNAAAVRNPIDAFILAKLEQKGLQPGSAGDRRTLVRRAYFDLHGLPPTPEQVEQFVNDQSPDAYEKLIDRLLASPRYGERWGRYWLDLVRYADTSGFETDHFFTTAWRYRDYVIASFNADKPYNTFVQEQIAADELWSTNLDLEGTLKLPKEKEENLNRRIGTSLFTLGSFPDRVHLLRRSVSRRMAGRRRRYGRRGVSGTHGRLRALPRSQVRSDQPARLLPDDGAVRRQRGARDSARAVCSTFRPTRAIFRCWRRPQVLKQMAGRWTPARRCAWRSRTPAADRQPRSIRRSGGEAPAPPPDPQRAALLQQARRSLSASARAIPYGQRPGARRDRSGHAHSDPRRFQEERARRSSRAIFRR